VTVEQSVAELPWLIAVGASGRDGFRDIMDLLSQFDRTLPAAVMVVLHRAFDEPSRLRDILAGSTSLEVIVVDEEERLRPGCCYIGEPARHLRILGDGLGDTTADKEKRHRNRTVDLLFTSIAEHAAGHAIAVVLSGALDDGSRGLEAIHHAGGLTMVITPHGEPGMPANAIAYDGPVDCIGSTQDIAQAIRRIVSQPPPTVSGTTRRA